MTDEERVAFTLRFSSRDMDWSEADVLVLLNEVRADERARCEREHGEKALQFAERVRLETIVACRGR